MKIFSKPYLSPNDIRTVNESKLLFVTQHDNGTSISLFDVDTLSITASKEINNLISQSLDFSRLFAVSEDRCKLYVISTENLETIEEIELDDSNDGDSFVLDKKKGFLHVVGKQCIFTFDINSDEKSVHDKKDAIGITENGYLVTYANSMYEFRELRPNSDKSGRFNYKSEGIRSFYGLAIENEDWSNNKINPFNNIEEIESEFKNDCLTKIKNGDNSKVFTKDINIKNNHIAIEVYPCDTGTYLVERTTVQSYKTIYYYPKNDRISGVKFHNSRKISWISGYEISYRPDNYYDFDKTLSFIDDMAIFSLSIDKEYIVLQKGRIADSFASIKEVKDKYIPKDCDLEESIIVNGEKVRSYNILCRSKSKCISKINNKYIFYTLESDGSWVESKTIDLEQHTHNGAKMSPDGKYLVYSKGRNQYVLYNIADQTEETVLTGNFVDFDNTGNLLFMVDCLGNPARFRELRIYDPNTFTWVKTIPEYYKFVSPDGKLYAKTALKVRYFDLIKDIEISKEQYDKICLKYRMNISASQEEKNRIINDRKKCIAENRDYFESLAKKRGYAVEWVDTIHNGGYPFEEFVAAPQQFIVIGIVGSDTELELKVDRQLDYLNYVSFSYDNRYVGIVGKPKIHGYLKLSQLEFDEFNNTLILKKDICDMVIADWATWICAFTRKGMFGTYDSEPNLYLIDQNNFEQFTEDKTKDFGFLHDHFRIDDRSLLCFSPSGNFMALSNQGYEAKSLGGRGHVPSNEVFIYSTDTKEMLENWHDQGDTIACRNVSNAGFSIDETKLMTVSTDGVIVVRNISSITKTDSNGLNVPLATGTNVPPAVE